MGQRKVFSRIFFGIVVLSLCVSPASAKDLRSAVVKIFVTSNQIDFLKPWQSSGSRSSSGSGCVISGNRILTNAHVVENNTFIQVRKESSPKKYTARAIAIGHDCDLAILSVDDPDFFEGVDPIPFGDLPELRDSVTVIGFPLGGDKLSITEGVVSRVEVIPYSQSARHLLGVQIDAAINPGNSGGPVIMNNKLVGIAMQLMTNSQNIGYMIPMPIITHFLEDYESGGYQGFPILGIEYTKTENEALRTYYRMDEKMGGIVVTNVLPFAPADQVLQKEDVLLAVDDIPIAEDCTFEFREGERLSFSHLINQKHIGEKARLKILRDGKPLEVKASFDSVYDFIPAPNSVSKPSYYIYGGLVFTVLTTDLMRSWGDKWWERAPFDFLYYLIGKGRLNKDRIKQVVVLLDVLPDDTNIGYLDFNNQVIVRVNGKKVDSFRDFVTSVEKDKGDYTVFETLDGVKIIISRKDIDEITDKIMARNNILTKYSADVKDWL